MQALHLFENRWANKVSSIILYCTPFFFIILADSIMSYLFPIVLVDSLSSNSEMGLIMALSSIAGLAADFLFPQIFKTRSWRFFLILGIISAILFPLTTFLGSSFVVVEFFLIGTIVWGIYFEFLMFSNQLFIVTEEKKIDYSKDWALVGMTSQITSIIGPIIGSLLIDINLANAFGVPIFSQIAALLLLITVFYALPQKKASFSKDVKFKSKINLLTEVKYWNLLIRSVWPVTIVGIMTVFINAAFWTIGGLFGHKIFGEGGPDWLIISFFSLPMILGSLIIAKIKPTVHKKRLSQLSLIIGSLILSLIYFANNNTLFILTVIFLGSFVLSFAQPLNDAVYSDLLNRLGKEKSHLLGIARSNSSIAYIFAPLLVGYLSDLVGYGTTFSIVTMIAVVSGIIALIFTPRKIRLPKKEMGEISHNN